MPREGGALVPTVAFGVPASAGMAILLGAFLIHGLVPGPDMLTKNLDITYSMVWSIAIANILGSGLCFLFSGQFAKLATLRYTLILPVVLCLVYIGAFEGTRNGAISTRCCSSACSAGRMKHFKWPRPPLVLGFILGEMLERYMFISIQRYGVSLDAAPDRDRVVRHGGLSLLRPFLQDVRAHGGVKACCPTFGTPHFTATICFRPSCSAVRGDDVAGAALELRGQDHSDDRRHRRDPVLRAEPGERDVQEAARQDGGGLADNGEGGGQQKIHMDIASNISTSAAATSS